MKQFDLIQLPLLLPLLAVQWIEASAGSHYLQIAVGAACSN
jgi:hypothetical protein